MKLVSATIIFILAFSCSSLRPVRTVIVNSSDLGPGSSGMAQVDENSFLAVYDLKNFERGPRLGLIRTYADSIRVFPVRVDDWKSTEGVPSDLEAITRIPDRKNEYLLVESGNWQGNLGRIFHIKYRPEKLDAIVKGVTKIPMIYRNDVDLVGDQYEGIACYGCQNEICNILISERGGSEVHPNGVLKWGQIDLKKKAVTFTESGLTGMTIQAPGDWRDKDHRDLTDLYIDVNGEIWASASEDRGDSGPFYSVIYQVGQINPESEIPFKLIEKMEVYKAFPGYKIEALSGPSNSAPDSRFSFGTEDEIYGGTWRPIE